MGSKTTALGVAICGAVTFVGVLLPWYRLGCVGAGMSFNGTQVDYAGGVTLFLGLVAGACALLLRKGPPQGFPLGAYALALVAVGAFGLAALLTVIDLFGHGPGNLTGRGGSPFSGRTGIGIYVTMGSTVAGAWLAWVLFKQTPAPPPSPASGSGTGSPPASSPPPSPPPSSAPPPAP